MYRVLLLSISLCTSLMSFCQSGSSTIDSLLRSYHSAKSDTVKIWTLTRLSEAYIKSNQDSAVYYGDCVQKLANRLLDKEISTKKRKVILTANAESARILGDIYSRTNNESKVEVYYRRSIELFDQITDLKNKARSMSSLARYYCVSGKPDIGLPYFEKVIQLQRSIKDFEGLSDTHMYLGNYYRKNGELVKGLEYLESSAQAKEESNDKVGSVPIYNEIGLIHLKNSNYSKSLHFFYKALKVSQKGKDKKGEAMSLSNIGQYYSRQEDFKNAINYTKRALQINQEADEAYGEAVCNNNLAIIYRKQQDYIRSIEAYQAALEIFTNWSRKPDIIRTKINMARVYISIDSISVAEDLYTEALDAARETKNRAMIGRALIAYADLDLTLNKTAIALRKTKEALEIAHSQGNIREIRNGNELLSRIYEKMGNWKLANSHYKTFIVFRDSVVNIQAQRKAIAKDANYQIEMAEKEVELLSQDKEIQTLKLKDQDRRLTNSRRLLTIVILISVLVVVLGLLIFNRYRIRRREQEVIAKQKELELKEKNLHTKTELEKAVLSVNYYKDLSHEIRTPLTLIIGPLEQLTNVIPESEKKRLDTILKNANRLMKLVNESLKVRLLETNGHSPTLRKCLVSRVIKRNIELFSDKSRNQNVSIEFIDKTYGRHFVFDEEKLDLVLINLLSNAFHHSNSKDRVVVCAEATNDQLTIEISDSGDGIPEEHLPHVFDRYYSVDEQKENSSGIGLALTKELVEMHNGTIEAKNSESGGAKFTICLPTNLKISESFMEMEEINEVSPQVSFASENAESILIVEDNSEVQNLLKEILSSTYKIRCANDGKEGIALAQEHQPALIISDVMMPNIDGTELTKTLKEEFSTSHIPIILLTAKSAENDKIVGLETGADDYLIKPFSPKELKIRVKNLIEQREKLKRRFSKNVFLIPEEITSTSLDQEFLKKATQIVEMNMGNSEFNVEKFCRSLALNRNSVHQKLKSLTGKSASQFIKSVKLKKAATLLTDERISIIEVSELSGFNNRQAFYKAFKEQFEMTPVDYRKEILSK